MNLTGMRRNVAVLSAAAIVGALGIGGVMTAQADSSGSGSGSHTTTDKSDGDGEVPDAQEQGSDGEANDDAGDTGPDANPNEPGHQDASDTGADN